MTRSGLAARSRRDEEELRASTASASRLSVIPGDLLKARFGKNHQVATLGHILHSEGPRPQPQALEKTLCALAPGGTIAIMEFLVNQDRTDPVIGLLFAVNMLVNTEKATPSVLRKSAAGCARRVLSSRACWKCRPSHRWCSPLNPSICSRAHLTFWAALFSPSPPQACGGEGRGEEAPFSIHEVRSPHPVPLPVARGEGTSSGDFRNKCQKLIC